MMKNDSANPKQQLKLYILHGWTYSLDAWQPTIKLLEEAGVELVFLRVPGLTKPSRKVFTIDDYVAWLDAQLKTARDPIVLGHSNGGRILLNYCATHPKKLRRLILLNSAGAPSSATRRLRNTCFRYLSKLFKPLQKARLARRLVHKLLRAGDYNQAPSNMKLTLSHMLTSDNDLLPKLAAVETPTDFIWGEKDSVTPISGGHFLYDHLPTATSFKILAEAKHAPYLTHPEALTEAVLEALVQ